MTAFTAEDKRLITASAGAGLPLPEALIKALGAWDKAGRWRFHPHAETASSAAIRAPSRAFPYSEWKHAHTVKYAKSLANKIIGEKK